MSFKRLILVFVIFVSSITAYAQQPQLENLPRFDLKRIHFGFTLGFNYMDFFLKNSEPMPEGDSIVSVLQNGKPGFQIGIISDLRLGDNLNLRFVPALAFGDRDIVYGIKYASQDTIYDLVKSAESTFLDFPLLFKYKTDRINNFRAYVLFGGKYSLDLASQSKKKKEDDLSLKLLPNDFSAEVGVGMDFYLEYFKFGIELKMSYGLVDVLKREQSPYIDCIDKLRSKMLWVCFNFE